MDCVTTQDTINLNLNQLDWADGGKELQKLIESWFVSAWERRHCAREDSFEPFIFLWIAFNSWGNFVTGESDDAPMIKKLCRDATLRNKFSDLIHNDTSFRSQARAFRDQWPIFSLKYLHRLNVPVHYDNPYSQQLSRNDEVTQYLNLIENAKTRGLPVHRDTFRPQCWLLHTQSSDCDTSVDKHLDWAHTLHAIYVIRCNLFHGGKSRYSEMDRSLVWCAFQVLVGFVHEIGYLMSRETRQHYQLEQSR